jgi:hypothetical protein
MSMTTEDPELAPPTQSLAPLLDMRDITLEMLVSRDLDKDDQKLLALMTKRVGVSLRMQRLNGRVPPEHGTGPYMVWEIANYAVTGSRLRKIPQIMPQVLQVHKSTTWTAPAEAYGPRYPVITQPRLYLEGLQVLPPRDRGRSPHLYRLLKFCVGQEQNHLLRQNPGRKSRQFLTISREICRWRSAPTICGQH